MLSMLCRSWLLAERALQVLHSAARETRAIKVRKASIGTVQKFYLEICNSRGVYLVHAVVEIRVRNWLAIFLKIGHFVGY